MDLTGRRFGRLTVLSLEGKSANNKNNLWKCACDCGNEKVIPEPNLLYGDTKSCGCLHSEMVSQRMKTHGYSKTRLYRVWAGMKNRCTNPNADNYKYYGGRGVSICDEWLNDFAIFREWALANGYDETKPKGACTLDRIDDNGNYCPENCRWADAYDQCNNQRSNVNITYNGETHTIKYWSRELGINYSTLKARLRKGIAFEQAIQ